MKGLEGNMMAQPRVFGHDANIVTIGEINIRIPAIEAVNINASGANYDLSDVGDTLTQASSTGSGSGIQLNITEISAGKTLQAIDIIAGGSGYVQGEIITLTAATSGGTGAKLLVDVEGLTLPNQSTKDRGAVIYNGKATAQDVALYTENYRLVTFKSVQPGTVVGDKVPILAKAVASGTDLVAIY
jgi:hypothetical protein